MAHIHLPDGSFSLEWVIIYSIAAAVLIIAVLLWVRSKEELSTEQKAISGVMAAIVFVITQIPIPAPWGGTHLNFTPLLGIIVGPALAVIVSIVVNILSAAIGHGGWTIIGPNIIIYSVESIVAWFIYKILRAKEINRFNSAAISTGLALVVGTLLLTLLIGIAGIQGSNMTGIELMGALWLLNAINLIVGAIEAVITGLIIDYIGKIRPDYIEAEKGVM